MKKKAFAYIGDFATVAAPFISLIGPFGPTALPTLVVCGLCTLLNSICYMSFYGLFGDKPRQLVERPKRARGYFFVIWIVSLALYLLLTVVFVERYGTIRYTKGFLISNDGADFLQIKTGKNSDWSDRDIADAINSAECDPMAVFSAWTVYLIEYFLLIIWMLMFVLLCLIWITFRHLYPSQDIPQLAPNRSASADSGDAAGPGRARNTPKPNTSQRRRSL